MKLYTDKGKRAPSPRRVRMYLVEKGIDVPVEELDLHRGNRTGAFRQKLLLSGKIPCSSLKYGRRPICRPS